MLLIRIYPDSVITLGLKRDVVNSNLIYESHPSVSVHTVAFISRANNRHCLCLSGKVEVSGSSVPRCVLV